VVVGTRTVTLADSIEVLRTTYGIKHRKTGEVIGFAGIDQRLESVVAWSPEIGRELLIFDSRTHHIVFDSFQGSRSGGSAAEFYPGLVRAIDEIVSRSEGEPEKFAEENRQYLASAFVLENPQWTVAIVVDLDAYIAEHEAQGLGLIVASLIFLVVAGGSIYALTMRVRRRTDELIRANEVVSEHNQMLEEELQTAHDMQMRLMPQKNPQVAGFEIVGRCRPATEVGGDFYQYFELAEDRHAIVLADVTGHGMKAAVPTMVFSGLLDNQIEYTPKPDVLMGRLNNSLHRVLERRTFICFSMGELDPVSRRLKFANGGCPYPYIYRAAANTVEEVSLVAFPLGLRAGSTYATVEVDLDENDLVIFCSDGLIEAANGDGELFGFERMAGVIRQAGIDRISAESAIQRFFDQVDAFSGSRAQEDDQTMVALRVVG
jgi:serine phosphatase RsbU (regulator of sigma subunit)